MAGALTKVYDMGRIEYKKLLVSGKICLFILENTNCTNNTNLHAGCYLCLSHTNCTNTIRMAFVLFASD